LPWCEPWSGPRGLAGQYAAGARLLGREADRSAFLATVAAWWAQLDPAEHPFVRQVATQLPEHDDREQFLVGIDLILPASQQSDKRSAGRSNAPATPPPPRSIQSRAVR